MDIRIFTHRRYYLQLFITVLLIFVSIFAVSGCGGGFQEDSENASDFENPIFHPEKVDTTK